MASETLYVATEFFHCNLLDGSPFAVYRDQTIVHEDDELRQRFPQYFKPAEGRSRPTVEDASASPGSKRGGHQK